MTRELRLTIPMEPPSGNHYKSMRVVAGHIAFYHTKAAKDWFICVQWHVEALEETPLATPFEIEQAASHEVEYTVYQGKGSRGDVDNYAKCILDGLVRSGVLRSDATVTDLICHKRRDRDNPRTEIIVRAL